MKRWFWLAAGFGLGVAASRRARRRHGEAVPARGGGVASWLRARVSHALAEGRQEAHRRERAIRDVLASTRNGLEDGDK